MKTPISDFINSYIKSDFSRFHMPGHKGIGPLGFEQYDITEIDGADVLYLADGIINESENNCSSLFKTQHSFYSTSGSTLAIYAMLALLKKSGEKPLILAARNCHKAFINACALLDFDIEWIIPENFVHICRCDIDENLVDEAIINAKRTPTAVYITSPDYLGNLQDISKISAVCKKHNIPLLCDNAHGAYLAFLKDSLHPIHLGATMCCDSAHKNLPSLTGGAYLHISKDAPYEYVNNARDMLSVFSTTSPSYLILQSLDLLNKYLSESFKDELDSCIKKVDELKENIKKSGFEVLKTEPLKIVINANKSGYTGFELAKILRDKKIEPEFCDREFLVLMVSPKNTESDFLKLLSCFKDLPVKAPINTTPIAFPKINTVCSVRDAIFSESEIVDISNACGRICSSPLVSCPPAVPIVMSGEEITPKAIELFKFYNISKIKVLK